jgi:hypothetical protein
MKWAALILALSVALAGSAQAKTHSSTHKAAAPPSHAAPAARTEVVVGRGWPIHRPLPTVVVRPSHTPVRVVVTSYLPALAWHPFIVPRPTANLLVWHDGDHLASADSWTEMTFNTALRGSRLFLEVESGRVQIQFIEVVFASGQSRVVDFQANIREQGFYPVLDFKEARDVDHVRIVARAQSDAARVLLHLQG